MFPQNQKVIYFSVSADTKRYTLANDKKFSKNREH